MFSRTWNFEDFLLYFIEVRGFYYFWDYSLVFCQSRDFNLFAGIRGFHYNKETDVSGPQRGFQSNCGRAFFCWISRCFATSAGSERAVGLGSWQRQRRASFCLGIIRMQLLLPSLPRLSVHCFGCKSMEFHSNTWYLS